MLRLVVAVVVPSSSSSLCIYIVVLLLPHLVFIMFTISTFSFSLSSSVITFFCFIINLRDGMLNVVFSFLFPF